MMTSYLYSWLDVKDRLADEMRVGRLQRGGLAVEAYWAGVEIYYAKSWLESTLIGELKEIFPGQPHLPNAIRLETGKELPLSLHPMEGEVTTKMIPSLQRPELLGATSNPLDLQPLLCPQIAFHSFKGGVGRTLHALALAFALEKKGKKVLLVDADFEAPGITWLFDDRPIALSDMLTMVHAAKDAQEREEVLDLMASALQDMNRGGIYTLPAFRGEQQMESLEIKPEHLFKYDQSPFVLTELLDSLAKRLAVDVTLVDLRAGLSELSSSWLLDERVEKVFVTTLSAQSVKGSLLLWQLLQEKCRQWDLKPAMQHLCVSQVDATRLQDFSQVTAESLVSENDFLQQQYQHLLRGFSLGEDLPVLTPLYHQLISLPSSFEAVKKLLSHPDSPITQQIEEGLLPSLSIQMQKIVERRKERLQRLRSLAQGTLYAEQAGMGIFLPTEPVRALADKFRTRLPMAVVVGSKGAGKTFLFSHLLSKGTWQHFVREINQAELSGNTEILPLLSSSNMERSEFKNLTIVEYLRKRLESSPAPTSWRDFWLDALAWAGGFQPGSPGAWEGFYQQCERGGEQRVFVVDGLEEQFFKYATEQVQQEALRSLLMDIPEYLAAIPQVKVGILIFIRRDMVPYAITQNTGQFLARYRDFALDWTWDDALRLAAFYLKEALSDGEFDVIGSDRTALMEYLYILWGQKMGSDNSREALSYRYVLSCLSNAKSETQARDLVRFLSHAADLALTAEADDRLLPHTAIRNAIPQVAAKKMEEVLIENKGNALERALHALQALGCSFPMKVEELAQSLSKEHIALLERDGILWRYANEWWYIAELFREGLGLGRTRGRTKVINPPF